MFSFFSVIYEEVVCHEILQAILHKNFFFTWIVRVAIGHFKQTLRTTKLNLENNGNFLLISSTTAMMLTLLRRKFDGDSRILTRARIAHQVHFLTLPISLSHHFPPQLEPPVQYSFSIELVAPPPFTVSRVDDETERGCIGAVEFKLGCVFGATGLVQVLVDKAFHGVDLEKVFCCGVVRI